jgi:hypothetical protein
LMEQSDAEAQESVRRFNEAADVIKNTSEEVFDKLKKEEE